MSKHLRSHVSLTCQFAYLFIGDTTFFFYNNNHPNNENF